MFVVFFNLCQRPKSLSTEKRLKSSITKWINALDGFFEPTGYIEEETEPLKRESYITSMINSFSPHPQWQHLAHVQEM